MSDANRSGDSNELEALFDSVVAGVVAQKFDGQTSSSGNMTKESLLMQQVRENKSHAGDSSELQALFDAAARERLDKAESLQDVADPPKDGSSEWPAQQGKVFTQIGQMARQLHNALGALGYDKLIEKTMAALPDAQDRLTYIANLTEQAACKVLNATDIANPLQEELEQEAFQLAEKWDALYANKLGVDEFKLLATQTRDFLRNAVPQRTSATKTQLMDIMMAQDFQDLTGQVIKKIVSLSHDVQSQLMGLLIETMPGEKRTESVNSLLNGPVTNAEGRTDVVVEQQQVDDLLESLGF